MLSEKQAVIVIAVAAVCTFATRVFPFAVFGSKREPPKFVKYLGSVLPAAIIGILIVYAVGDVRDTGWYSLAPKLIGAAITALVHLWKRNTLISIASGTIGYMLLINFVFK